MGFPEGVLGKSPKRLRVLYHEDGVIGLEKASGVLIDVNEDLGVFPSLVPAIRCQLKNNKPELRKYAFQSAYGIYGLDPEVTGVALIASNREACVRMRNLYGSSRLTFKFLFLAKQRGLREENEIVCELPLLYKKGEGRLVVSHKMGKKSKTVFRLKARLGPYGLWEAVTYYYRLHQVRVHALESGLSIVGDRLYGGAKSIFLSNLKRAYKPKGVEKPLYKDIMLHLASVAWVEEGRSGVQEVVCPLLKKQKVVIKRLKEVFGEKVL